MIEFTRWEGALQRPGACVCGSQRRPVVDTHIENALGRVYLCELCVTRAARAHGGFVSRDEFDATAARLLQADAANDELQRQLGVALDPANRTITAGELNEWLSQQQTAGGVG